MAINETDPAANLVEASSLTPAPANNNDMAELAADTQTNVTSDGDSLVSQDTLSSTASISSSILDYRQSQGRTYHSDKFTLNYFLPNDNQQLDSIDLSHHYLAILLDNQLYLAPLKEDKIQRVLDVGTGTGIWAIELADRLPHASVIGTDLSPCQPNWLPPNVRFEVDDATLAWTWDADTFEFIHIRYLFGAIKDWSALFAEAYRCCVPGGWVQSGECDVEFRCDDGSIDQEPVLETYGSLFREGGEVMGRPFFVQELQQQAFEDAGFVDRKTVRYKLPIGGWPKDKKLAEVGRVVKQTLDNDLEGYTLMMWQNVLNRPMGEYHAWLASLRKAIHNPNVHGYFIVHYVYGRKPE